MAHLNLNTFIFENYNKGKQILDILTHGMSDKWGKQDVFNHLQKNNYTLAVFTPYLVERMVSRANQMVKSSDCPHNQMNRFYQWKHKYIKRQIQTDNVDEVYESGNHYRFVLKSGISFHQLKNTFPNGVPYETKHEIYMNVVESVPYDNIFVNATILQIALQLG